MGRHLWVIAWLAAVVVVAPRPAASQSAPGCSIIDFETRSDGLPSNTATDNALPVGTYVGTPTVAFGPSWLLLCDADAGGSCSGNFANEPSPDFITFFLDTNDPINFIPSIGFVQVSYTASAASIPVTMTAYSGPNCTGSVVATAVGNTVGLDVDGAPCTGDPAGGFCLFDTLTIDRGGLQDIASVCFAGAVANQFGFDNMAFCLLNPCAIDCDDGDACTTDTCDTATGCQHAQVSCDDNDACTTDGCDPASGCTHASVSCDDGNACTNDTCDATGCQHGPVTCDDNNTCTIDGCDTATGCTHVAVSCDDGDACTLDACDSAAGGCVHVPNPDCNQACPCEGPQGPGGPPWKNHGEYVVCVVRMVQQMRRAGLISGSEGGAIISAAGRSDCGK